jgi:broad specificity phosphatase PhoE
MEEVSTGDAWDKKHGRLAPAKKFSKWQPVEYREGHHLSDGVRDPCLTDYGIQVAGKGVNDGLRLSLGGRGYAGPVGGLQPVGQGFSPELIVTSPLSRALQTALVMFDRCRATILVCPALTELLEDDTQGGMHPDGMPNCQGMSRPMLQTAIEAHPRSSGGLVELADFDSDVWYDAHRSYESKCKRFGDFLRWLAARPERRIAVVSHGMLLVSSAATQRVPNWMAAFVGPPLS